MAEGAGTAAAFVCAEQLFGLAETWHTIETAAMPEAARLLLFDRTALALRNHMADLLRAGAGTVAPSKLIAALAPGIGARVAKQHEIAMLTRDGIDAAHHFRVKGIAEVRHHREQQAAFGGAQVAREIVDAIAARLHGGKHAIARLGPDVRVPVEHARDSGDRDAGLLGHAGNRHVLRRSKRCNVALARSRHGCSPPKM